MFALRRNYLILCLSFCQVHSASPTFEISKIPDGNFAPLGKELSQYIDVFGIPVLGTKSTPSDKVKHAAVVLAEYLDNDEAVNTQLCLCTYLGWEEYRFRRQQVICDYDHRNACRVLPLNNSDSPNDIETSNYKILSLIQFLSN